MTPTEYEHHVATMLRAEGWDAHVTPPSRDFGLDIVGEREERKLGVQVKMYGAGRRMNAQTVRELFGAAKFHDCTDVMLVTDGRVLDDAVQAANKLGIEVRHVPIPDGGPAHRPSINGGFDQGGRTFDRIWAEHVIPLVGQVLTRGTGTTNEVVSVDWSGLTRRTSNGSIQMMDVGIFRWAIDQLLSGQVVAPRRDQRSVPEARIVGGGVGPGITRDV
jgi:hypothetical protein